MKAEYVEYNGQYISKGYAETLRKRGAYQPVGGLAATVTQQNQVRPLVGKPPAVKGRKKGVVVVITFVPCVGREVDEDNYGHSQYKSVRDTIARGLALDDGDKRLRFEYAPPVVTKGKTGTQILITATT